MFVGYLFVTTPQYVNDQRCNSVPPLHNSINPPSPVIKERSNVRAQKWMAFEPGENIQLLYLALRKTEDLRLSAPTSPFPKSLCMPDRHQSAPFGSVGCGPVSFGHADAFNLLMLY